ncbi:cytochrome c-type biogenesis protein CcmE [Salmonella sp. NCTC 11881]|nr:cytochrome c-type biogenesis protein CcmE [Salmonella sp. NCTC 11881]
MRGYCRTCSARGRGVVVQGTLEKGNHVLAHEVLAKHDENYHPAGSGKGDAGKPPPPATR